MKICVIGLGYIGLPTAAIFSSYGHQVVGVDVKEHVVKKINNGEIHIEEPGLGEMVKEAVNKKRLRASTKPEEADVFVIAVPTPNDLNDNMGCDLNYVVQACSSIIPHIKRSNIVIVESTIDGRRRKTAF